MVGILDNKNIAELVVEQDDNNGYLKINPETLATIVENVSKTEDESNVDKVSYSVQQHMDDDSIHLTKVDVQQLTSNMLEVEDIVAGSNVTVERVPDTNNIVISATDFNNRGFVTVDDIIPEDDTITITPNPNDDGFKIRANIPDVSKMVKQRNIKSGDSGINIEYDEDSNDVYIYGEGNQFKAGVGLEIVDNVINNTAPDKIVTLTGGNNIVIDGEYPDFTISSSDAIRIADWSADTHYDIDDFVVYENSLMRCLEDHTSAETFESDKWELIAGWAAKRQHFFIENTNTTDIVLNEVVPNKDVLIVNIGGIVQQSLNYELQPDGQTLRFINPLPKDCIVEVLVMSNVVMDTYDTDVNIANWQSNTAYAEGNIVSYENNLYVCLERHISTAIFDKSKWKLMCGYLKSTYRFDHDEDITEITLPVYLHSKELIEVNVSNTILLQSTYDIDETGYKIIFNKTIEAGLPIEVSVYNSGTIQLPEIPAIENKAQYFLTTDDNGQEYILRSVDNVMEMLNLQTLLDYAEHPNSIITVNPQGDGYRYLEFNELSGILKAGQLIDGLELSKTESGNLRVESGATIDENKEVLLSLNAYVSKDVTTEFDKGFNRGSSVGTDLDDWIQPVMRSNLTDGYQIFTSDYITDREGWRAMDGMNNQGNGWLVNAKTAVFRFECTDEIVLQGFDFYNTMSGTINHSKDIDIWIGDESNVIKSFTALNEDYGYSHIEFENDTPNRVVGFTIKSSYGQCCGAKEVKFIAKSQTFLAKNHCYYVYLLGNDKGVASDVATSIYTADEFANHLPEGFSRYALIGTFNTDNEYNIVNCFPTKELKKDWIEGTLVGTISDNTITTRVFDEQTKKPILLLEQFGDSTTDNGRVNFPQSFSKLLYVFANGEKVISKDNNGFNVNSDIANVSWIAKGYK